RRQLRQHTLSLAPVMAVTPLTGAFTTPAATTQDGEKQEQHGQDTQQNAVRYLIRHNIRHLPQHHGVTTPDIPLSVISTGQ
ncbi:hypothetical protein K7016_004755, partial [Escherichia coli]|nr:hypothetical protein [Escherichia coli]